MDYGSACLPKRGRITLGNFSTAYVINSGFASLVHNAKYEENQFGHGMLLSEYDSPRQSDETAIKLAREAAAHHPAKMVRSTYKPRYGDMFNEIHGVYLLVEVSEHTSRGLNILPAILFVGDHGQVYQHYESNQLPPAKVITSFEALVRQVNTENDLTAKRAKIERDAAGMYGMIRG